jgi:hypothetical protein
LAFAKDNTYQSGCPKNAALEELSTSMEFSMFLFILDP